MRYRASPAFDRSIRRLDPPRKQQVREGIDALVAAFETGQVRPGLGLTQLRKGLWELRAGLSDRVIFLRSGDVVTFIYAGNHDDIQRVLRRW